MNPIFSWLGFGAIGGGCGDERFDAADVCCCGDGVVANIPGGEDPSRLMGGLDDGGG